LATSVKEFSSTDDDGIIKGDYVCFREKKLLAKIRAIEPSADFDDVVEYLKRRLALKPGSDGNSRKIAGSKLRFYCIRRSMLL
jgi:hypothetical protein